MQNAYECEEEFGKGGQCVKRVRRIGAIVPSTIMGITAVVLGRDLPAAVSTFFQNLLK